MRVSDSTLRGAGIAGVASVIVYSALYYADTPEKAAPCFVLGVLIYLITWVTPQLDRIESLLRKDRDGEDAADLTVIDREGDMGAAP